MDKEQNLAELTRDISENLLTSINLLEILEEISEAEPKTGTVISLLQTNLRAAFEGLEICRNKIYILD
jgi:hypothetical protein